MRPSLRTNSKAKIKVRTPGGISKLHVRERKYSGHKCMYCGKPLGGTINGISSFVAKFSKTKKRPNRYFGGQLCPSCLKRVLIINARAL